MGRLLHPAGLWMLLGALPVVLLYVLRARRRRVKVPSTMLWAAAQRDLLARSPWRKLVPEVSLALELLAVAALALAASRPSARGRDDRAEHVAFVLDTSASMQAADGAEPRIERARAALGRLVDRLPPGAEAMLIEAGRDARVLAPMARERGALRAAIARARARDVEGSLAEALSLAADRVRPLDGLRRVVVVTDGAVARRDVARPSDVPVEAVRVGAPAENAALVRLDVRAARGPTGADVAQVFALVANFAARPRDVDVSVRRDGDDTLLGAARAHLEAAARAPVVVTFTLTPDDAGRGLVVRLAPGDALAVDDVAYARVPPGATLPVVLAAAEENPWLRRALTSDPGVALQEGPPEAAADAPPGALVVFDGACPSPMPARDALVVAPPAGGCAGLTVQASVDAPSITSYASADPRLRFLTMDGVRLASATPLSLGLHGTELLRSSGGVLFADASTPEHAVTVLGVDMARTDWPLHASFVVFVRNVVELSRARRARAASGGGRTGEPLRVAVPARVASAQVRGPLGDAAAFVTAGTAVVGDTSRAGLYALRWRDGATLVPVNLLSDAESDLRAAPWEPPAAPRAYAVARSSPTVDLSPWFAALAALAVLADLAWLTRPPAARPARRPAEAT